MPVCGDAAAAAGACPEASRVGSVSSLAGTGDAPVSLSGGVYLTGAYDGGFAGLAIVIPGKVGPVDLGTVIVRGSIALRADGGLTVRTTPLPRLIGGVPVSIRQLALSFDRPGFILNASSCSLKAVRAVLEGVDGATATVEAPYQATDCAGLPFSPRIEATVGKRGATAAGKAPPLRVTVLVPEGQAATAVANVGLPAAIGIDLKRLAKACSQAAFSANACPATSRIGSATATSPLLPTALTSPVTFAVTQPNSLPGLALSLTGAVTLPLFGEVGLPGNDGVLHNSFGGHPGRAAGALRPLLHRRHDDAARDQEGRLPRRAPEGHGDLHRPQRQGRQRERAAEDRRLRAGRDAQAPRPPPDRADQGGPRRRGDQERDAHRPGGEAAQRQGASQTLTLKKLPGKKTFRLVVKDKAKQSWTLKVKVK